MKEEGNYLLLSGILHTVVEVVNCIKVLGQGGK